MKRVWTEEKDNLLRRHYPKRDVKAAQYIQNIQMRAKIMKKK